MCEIDGNERGNDGDESVIVNFFLEERDTDSKCDDDADTGPDEVRMSKVGELVCLVQKPSDCEVTQEADEDQLVTMFVVVDSTSKAKLCDGFGDAHEYN
jgi:hypothetical protein